MMRTRQKKNRQQYGRKKRGGAQLAAIKLASGCVDCGYNKCAAALEFDHVIGEKNFEIAERVGPGPARDAELVKCVIRCANCHRERHAGAPIEW